MAQRRLRNRNGKIVTSHSTYVEGLIDFIKKVIEPLDEVSQVRIGRLETRNTSGRSAKQVKPTSRPEGSTYQPAQVAKRASGGGAFSFRATRWAMIGTRVTGVKCDARHGTLRQEVILLGDDCQALRQCLAELGLGGNF